MSYILKITKQTAGGVTQSGVGRNSTGNTLVRVVETGLAFLAGGQSWTRGLLQPTLSYRPHAGAKSALASLGIAPGQESGLYPVAHYAQWVTMVGAVLSSHGLSLKAVASRHPRSTVLIPTLLKFSGQNTRENAL